MTGRRESSVARRGRRQPHESLGPDELRVVMTDPATYSKRTGPIETRETHSSLVFLAGPDVFKAKKAVDLGFLDYSTPHRRALMCRREVTLNQRLAPSVYLGVKRLIRLPTGQWAIRKRGPAVEYLVHMRRLPDSATLESRIAEEVDAESLLVRVGRRLAEFHEAAPPVPARYGSPALFLRNAQDNFREIASSAVLGPLAIEPAIRSHTEQFLHDNAELFASRIAEGRIRDGHGDLRCDHVYVEDDGTLSIIDCLEFSKALRGADVALDLAFLYMNLVATGYPDLGATLVGAWEDRSGDSISALLPFFTCYRAMVRAKVSHIRSVQAPVHSAEGEAALLDSMTHLNLAARMAAGGQRPRLTLMAGLPASGKSTVARIVAGIEGGTLLVADQIRKELAGIPPESTRADGLDSGLYAPEMNERVYSEMGARATVALRQRRNVVLDATHRRRSDRNTAARIARDAGARFLAVECRAPEAVVRKRMEDRSRTPGGWSDAGWDVYVAHRETFEPVLELPPEQHISILTDRSHTEIARLLLPYLAGAGQPR